MQSLVREPIGFVTLTRCIQGKHAPACRSRAWQKWYPGAVTPLPFRTVPNSELHNGQAIQMIDEARHSTIQQNLGERGTLVIRHVDQLNARRLHALSAALQDAVAAGRHRSLWVVVTLRHRKIHEYGIVPAG